MTGRKLISSIMFAVLTLPAAAQVPDNVVQIGILSGWRENDGRHIAGLSIRLAPGWKTYWRAPGEGGIPPAFDWSGSTNLQGVTVHYPVPEIFYQNGFRSIGYLDEVLFPLVIETKDSEKNITLRGSVEIGVCEDICIPVSFSVAADLMPDPNVSPAISAALADRPRPGGRMSCEIGPISDGLRVAVEAAVVPMGDSEVAIIEAGETGLWISEASVSRNDGRLRAVVEMVPPNAQPFALVRGNLRLTVLGNGDAVEILGCD